MEDGAASGLVAMAPDRRRCTGEGTDDQREIEAVVDTLGHTARIELRKPRYSQAAAFAAALPLGLVLPSHSNVSQSLRDMA